MTSENKAPPIFVLWLVLSSIDRKIDVALTFTVFTFVFECLMWSQEKKSVNIKDENYSLILLKEKKTFHLNLATVLSSFKKVFQNFGADSSTPFTYIWAFI